MIRLEAYAAGIHPRSEPLVKETWAADKGSLPREKVRGSFRREAQALARRQRELGFAFVSDGQLRWQDKFRPLVEASEGLQVGPLTRYYETNTFFKQPLVTGELRLDGAAFAEWVESDAFPAGRGAIQLPSPHYFAHVADDRHYGGPEALAEAFARLLNDAARILATRGVGLVEFADPHLLYARKEDAGLARSIALATRGVEAATSYFAFNGPVGPRAEELAGLEVDIVGFDATRSTPEEAAPLAGKGLALGLVAGDNSLLEDPGKVAARARTFAAALSPSRVLVRPQWDLEFVPEPIAARKLELLGRVAGLAEVKA